MELCAKLRDLRLKKGYTLKQTAAALNLTISAYSNYEQGIREPSLEIIKKICVLFEVSADYLLGLDN